MQSIKCYRSYIKSYVKLLYNFEYFSGTCESTSYIRIFADGKISGFVLFKIPDISLNYPQITLTKTLCFLQHFN